MIRPLILKHEIDEAYTFFSRIVLEGGEQVESVLGYQGGSVTATLTWFSDKKFWVCLEPERIENRFWCAFGTEDPTANSTVNIICEINAPRVGFNRMCAGLFISDNSGSVYLAHSGKVGGGRPGVGKISFMSAYDTNDIVPVVFPTKKEFDYIVVGRIDDLDFMTDLARFVHAVAKFKNEAVHAS